MRYKEILELESYCNKVGVETEKTEMFGGYCLMFNNGGDVVQHAGSYGAENGCVEFGFTGFSIDFRSVSLEKAKDFVKIQKDALNKKKPEDN